MAPYIALEWALSSNPKVSYAITMYICVTYLILEDLCSVKPLQIEDTLKKHSHKLRKKYVLQI